MGRRKPLVLRVGPDTYYRTSGHAHGPGGKQCREYVRIARDGSRGTGLTVSFQAGPGRLVADGLLHIGGVIRGEDDAYLNLHRPAVVRALLDVAIRRGWDTATELHLDGWLLLDDVLAVLPPEPDATASEADANATDKVPPEPDADGTDKVPPGA
ncbi:hypothetical protein [Actinomadura rupiterrae]|uniref:hypothetical protein n=1 Tax=Actinomadura rupiterrae TaxID=559627 RepID=UPI0020A2DB9B|nr:hypothetical protein [Actinomadura rupiterrae]MCP2337832.1 hypothetical protein [Actinomadura rupiterrae]